MIPEQNFKNDSIDYWVKSFIGAYILGYSMYFVYLLIDYLVYDKDSYISQGNVLFMILYVLFWPIVTVGAFSYLFTTNANQVACMDSNFYCLHLVQMSIYPLILTYSVAIGFLMVCKFKKPVLENLYSKKIPKGAFFGLFPIVATLFWVIIKLIQYFWFSPSYPRISILETIGYAIFETQVACGWNIFYVSFILGFIFLLRKRVSKIELLLVILLFTVFYLLPALFIYMVITHSNN